MELLDTSQSWYKTLIYTVLFALSEPLAIKTCFLWKESARHTAQEVLLDVRETLQTWHNYFQGGDRELH